jgi:hypothetical protein
MNGFRHHGGRLFGGGNGEIGPQSKKTLFTESALWDITAPPGRRYKIHKTSIFEDDSA